LLGAADELKMEMLGLASLPPSSSLLSAVKRQKIQQEEVWY
jgi:hypothetical protein